MTLKDIARIFNVSPSTISRALRDDTRISESLRKEITEYAEKAGYRKNAIARNLKTNRSHTIGFIAPEIANDFFMNVAQGVEDELKKAGYSLIICNSNENPSEEKRRIDLLLENRPEGIIIIPSSHEGKHLQFLRNTGLPFVLIDRLCNDITADAVLVDNTGGTYRAIEYLIQKGIRRIGFIGGDMNLTSAKERFTGYIRALEDYNIPLDNGIIQFGDFHVESGYRCMKNLMDITEPPLHVFIANVFMHLGAAKYILENRKHETEKINTAGFDEMYLSPVLGLASCTVSQPVNEIGRQAARILFQRIRGENLPFPKIMRLDTKLHIHKENFV